MTQYLVCPHCRTVTPVMPERTISEAAYHVLTVAQDKYPDRKRIHLASLADDCAMNYETVRYHVKRLVSAGIAFRVPLDARRGWYYVQPAAAVESAERRADPGVSGEGIGEQESAPSTGTLAGTR